MTKANFIRDSYLWWGVKIVAAVYQVSATYRVFYNNLTEIGRSKNTAMLDSILAILLIDAFFISILYLLESDEISTFDKLPLVLIGLALTAAIIAIGASDEGTMAWMPRVGVIGLVMVDTFRWCSDVGRLYFNKRAYHNSREYQEQKIRDEEVIMRKNSMKKARKEAFEKLYPEFVQVQLERERRNLNHQPEEKPALTLSEETVEEPYIIKLNNGFYGWVHPDTGQTVTESKLGKPYSQQGARLAYLRSLNHKPVEA